MWEQLLSTVGGGVIGGTAQALENSYYSDRMDDRTKNANKKLDAMYDTNKEYLDAARANAQNVYGTGPDYNTAYQTYLNTSYDPKTFEYGKSTEDFYDPAANKRVATSMEALRSNAGLNGGNYSTNFINKVNNASQTIASDEWSKAYDRMMKDKDSALQVWKANNDEQTKAYNDKLTKANKILDMSTSNRDKAYEAEQNYYTNLINNNISTEMAKQQNTATKNAYWMNQPSVAGALVQGASAGVNTYQGGK